MDKRQDLQRVLFQAVILIVFSALFLIVLAACRGDFNPDSLEPTTSISARVTDTPAALITTAFAPTTQKPTPSPGVECRSAGGAVLSESLFSEQLGEELRFQVYLPPCYEEDVEIYYPVTYLLHGLSYAEDQWLRLGVAEQMDALIAEGCIAPFIIVLPGESRFQLPPHSAFPDALGEELIPWVDQHYRTLPEKPYRVIAGLSRGAAWAVHIGLLNPQLFSRVGAHSLPLFSSDSSKLNTWLAEIPVEELPWFFIDIGRTDPERWSAQDFADRLNTHHIPHTWYLFNGGHTETYWSSHLELYLHWYALDW